MRNFYIVILFLSFCMMISGCVASNSETKIKSGAFNVLPTYCYDKECFDIKKEKEIKLFNSNLPDEKYQIEVEKTTITDSKKETVKSIKQINVNGNIITIDSDDILIQYRQNDHKIINLVDKSGTISKKQLNSLKDTFKKSLGLFLCTNASSGDILNSTVKMDILGASLIVNMSYFVHGITTYEEEEYVLLEVRGAGKVNVDNQTISVTFGGYSLFDNRSNIWAKTVLDLTIEVNKKSESFKSIAIEKKITK